ncbi:unnamed protein product [Tuber aestivum]|uniref:Uncharacterized protein n=1 Tax=Tuber aestivum TaxID=59557 RepID=A0A292Q111_9PEZI|nr:unnamed protein product [Tuber aestivum]
MESIRNTGSCAPRNWDLWSGAAPLSCVKISVIDIGADGAGMDTIANFGPSGTTIWKDWFGAVLNPDEYGASAWSKTRKARMLLLRGDREIFWKSLGTEFLFF